MELPVKVECHAHSSTQVLHDLPRVTLTVNAVNASDVRVLRKLAEPRLQTALLSGATGGTIGEGRTCDVTWISHDETPTVQNIVDIVAAIAGIAAGCAERLQVIRYSRGGQYRPHFDSYDLESERGRRCTTSRGQRTHTALLYLNNDFAGGATIFPRLNLEVRPLCGAVLTFENCVRGTTMRHKDSLHAGAPVTEGEKWVATLWFRER